MSKSRVPRLFLALALLAAATAHAQLFRAYLTSDGNDANPCTLPQPCRLLPAALSAVADKGEIWMLDSANYNTGTVTIGKSVAILAIPGAVGSIVALNGGPAISITAADLVIALRNVVIGPVAGATPGTHGIHMTGASSLSVENSLIANLPVDGIKATGAGTVTVSGSTLRNIENRAINLTDGPSVTIAASRFIDNFVSVSAFGSTTGTTAAAINDSTITGSAYCAVHANTSAATAIARIAVLRSTVERSTYALCVTTNGPPGTTELSLGSSLVFNNDQSWYVLGGGTVLLSLGNNQVTGNNSATGTLTLLAPQ